jgi:CubicO group peptidase (beta-lactamase class C family)
MKAGSLSKRQEVHRPLSERKTMRSTTALVLVATLAVAAPARSQEPSPAVQRLREYVALVNDGDPAAVAAYVDTAFNDELRGMPMDLHVGFVMDLRLRSGGLDPRGIQRQEEGLAVGLLRQRLTGDWDALAVRVEPDPPHRIAGLGGREPEVPSDSLPPAPATDAERATRLREHVDRLAEADAFSGAVLLARDGEILTAGAWGEANKDFGAPNRVETKFNLGSMNKMFTAVAIAQLVERGLVRFDDPLSKFLPDFPDPDAAKRIRIEHLLTHTSGLGSYFNERFFDASRARFRTVDDLMTLAAGDSLRFEPGTGWSYSNTGFLVLGKVIEVASGQDYFEYVRENICGPAGMTGTDAYELDRVNPDLAVGYQREWSADGTVLWRNNLFEHVIRGGPAGGGYSTVGDLWRFAEALMSGRLVGAESVRALTTAKPELSSPEYGYGFVIGDGGGIVGHGGGFPGISSNLDIFTESGYVAVVLSNYGRASGPVVGKIRRLVGAG